MRTRKVDANHKAIMEAFRRLGCLVHHTAGDWDIEVSKHGLVALVEIKDPTKPKSKVKLTRRSQALIEQGWPIHLVKTLDDALGVCETLRRQAMVRDKVP